jgi:hypothetical protein
MIALCNVLLSHSVPFKRDSFLPPNPGPAGNKKIAKRSYGTAKIRIERRESAPEWDGAGERAVDLPPTDIQNPPGIARDSAPTAL